MAYIHTPIPLLKLNDGNSIPMLGFGLGTAWYKVGEEAQLDQVLIDATKKALELGYTNIDGAELYKTEQEQGQAVKESGIAREKLFITTKVSTGIQDPLNALKASLKKLQMDYVDLYLIHKPFYGDESPAEYQKTWAIMEDLKAQGLARSIGVSNFLPAHLEAILATAKVKPALNQIEFHAYLQHPELLALHKKHSIATAAYAPLTPVTKATGGPVDEYVAALAKKYAVNPSEVLLRWCVDQDVVAITTSSKEQRLSDYLRSMTFKLTPKEIAEINELGSKKNFRGFLTKHYKDDDFS